MAKFDKEIKEASKIGKGWIKTSEGYQGELIGIKKTNLKWEKDALTRMQVEIKKREHLKPGAAKGYLDECDVIKERLDSFVAAGQRLFDAHEKWSLKEPRTNMGFIGTKLKLGKPGTEMYDAVAKALKKQLTDVANTIKATQNTWGKDLEYTLEIQQKRVKALRKIVSEGGSAYGGFIKQIKKEAIQFVKFCDKAWVNISGKVPSHAGDLKQALSGQLAEKNETSLQQQFQIYESRLTEIPKLIAMIEKNHNRVLKSVPKEFINGFMTSQEKKVMTEKKADLLGKLKQTENLYSSLVSAYKKQGLV